MDPQPRPDAKTGQWPVFRALLQPNAARAHARAWRASELAQCASELAGAPYSKDAVGVTLRKQLLPKDLAHTVRGGRNCTLWCPTHKACAHAVKFRP
jgi:hypothetical protein